VSGFKRGDALSVKITPFDGETYGRSKVLSTEIQNVTPKVIEEKNVAFDGKQLKYQLKAVDPDGDSLTYTLVDAPKDMTIDPKSGLIDWTVQPENQEPRTINVKITDGHGGEIVYPLKVSLAKGETKEVQKDRKADAAK
jgi:hypothetical protein